MVQHHQCVRRSAVGLVLVWLIVALAMPAAAADVKSFFGAYVGVAQVEDAATGATEERDMDIVIKPFHRDGFQVHWINVSLVDGRRDRPGVKRRVQNALFEPAEDRDFFVEVDEDNPFRETEGTQPMRGDPVRWAKVDGGHMQVCSFVVLEDGQYELQVYDRVLTESGMDIQFQRILDGEVVRRVTGTTVRVE